MQTKRYRIRIHQKEEKNQASRLWRMEHAEEGSQSGMVVVNHRLIEKVGTSNPMARKRMVILKKGFSPKAPFYDHFATS